MEETKPRSSSPSNKTLPIGSWVQKNGRLIRGLGLQLMKIQGVCSVGPIWNRSVWLLEMEVSSAYFSEAAQRHIREQAAAIGREYTHCECPDDGLVLKLCEWENKKMYVQTDPPPSNCLKSASNIHVINKFF